MVKAEPKFKVAPLPCVSVPLPDKESLMVKFTLFVMVPFKIQSLKVKAFPVIDVELPDRVVLLLALVLVHVPLLLMFPAITNMA